MAKAQKGDLIRIVKEKRYGLEGTEDFVLGAIYEVDCIDYDGDINFTDNRGASRYLSDTSMYEIHRKAGEEDVATVPTKATLHSREEVLPRHEVEAMPDAVNQPSHYTQGRFETIEIIEEITQGYSDGYVAYCVGNALKYLARAPFKHGEPTEDISKAAKYLEFALERLQSKSAPR